MRKEGLFFNLILATVFINICIPKAGIKIAEIPLTLGNILLLLCAIIWIVKKIASKKIKTHYIGIPVLSSIFYVTIKYTIAVQNGYNILSYISYIIPLVVYPIIYFIIKDEIDSNKKRQKLYKTITLGYFIICSYAVLQFLVGIGNCDIPGITVNLTDYNNMGNSWFLMKNNGVSESTKIMSTYQNGNLFGINLLIIYPFVFFYLKNNKSNRKLIISLILFISCELLTLSRACWAGIVLFIFFAVIFKNDKTKKGAAMKIVYIFSMSLLLLCIFTLIPTIAERLFNTSMADWIGMSGRTNGFINVFKSVDQSNQFLPWLVGPEGIIKYNGIAYEMLPVALFAQLGIIGIIIVYHIFIKLYYLIPNNSDINYGIKLSILIWLIVGIIECAYWIPPTAFNLFAIMGLFVPNNTINKETI